MKKILSLGMLLTICLFAIHAQSELSLFEGINSFVYSLPKSKLCFEIEIETQNEKPGIFYQYSQRYLATDKVVIAEKTTATVTKIEMKQCAIPDLNRRFMVEIQSKQFNPIVVNEQGILCGVNVAIPNNTVPSDKAFTSTMHKNNNHSSNLLPLTQEYMMAGSIAKMAEGAAIQIYNIRSSRLNLLSGEVDIMPDGQALQLMLEKLDAKEKELTELFTGDIIKEVKTYKVYMTPETAITNEILFRLSSHRGVVSQDDLSGKPYYITIRPEVISIEKKDSKTKSETVGLYTVLPANTEITVTDGLNILYQQNIQIPQLGKLITLPESILKEADIKISVDPSTGRLLGIEK